MATNDWSKFYNQEIEEDIEENKTDINDENLEEDIDINQGKILLSVKDYKEFCDRLTGYLDSGKTKAIPCYQTFIAKENEGINSDNEIVYTLNNAVIEISLDELHPELAVISIRFKSFDDPELRLLWARIQKWRTNMSKPQDNNGVPIFLFSFTERESFGTYDGEEEIAILSCEVINPLLCYITREVPTMEATDILNDRDEHIGGNVIKLLCDTNYITFSLRDDINTKDIKAEVERELEEERYINSAPYYEERHEEL